jgi:hypothetical protein
MSSGELERVEVMGRMASGGPKVMDAAAMLQLRFTLTAGLDFSAHSNDNINRKKGTFLIS